MNESCISLQYDFKIAVTNAVLVAYKLMNICIVTVHDSSCSHGSGRAQEGTEIFAGEW